MNGKTKMVRMLGAACLSAAVILASQSSAVAKSKRPSRDSAEARRKAAGARRKVTDPRRKAAEALRKVANKQAEARRRIGRPRTVKARPTQRNGRDCGRTVSLGRSDSGIRFSINLGGATRTTRRWIPATYETRIEKVLVEAGHYEWRTEQVVVQPGRYETRHVPAVEQVLYDSNGNAHRVIVRPAGVEKVWVPPTCETRRVRVWVPPRYEMRQVRVLIPRRCVTQTVRTPSRSGLNLSALFGF